MWTIIGVAAAILGALLLSCVLVVVVVVTIYEFALGRWERK